MRFGWIFRAGGLAAILGALILVFTGRTQGADEPASIQIDRELSAAVARGDIPGVVAMAMDRRGVVYQGAFGVAEGAGNRAMTTDSIFRMHSMTKAVTSVALMQLVEQGRVSLDDLAEKYLPELANPMVFEFFDPQTHAYRLRPAASAITVRQLATHTSGLGYPFISATLRDFQPRPGEHYAAGPLLFDPGTQWTYSKGVDLIGRLVEKVSGQTLAAYDQEHIFGLLGMVDTGYNVPPEKQARVVNVFDRQPDGGLREEPRVPFKPVTKFGGGGGLYSTAADYMRFLQMLLNGGERDGVRILARDTVAVMTQNQIGNVGVRALKTALPLQSSDFSFVSDGRDKWGLGFMITADQAPGKRSAGSLSWAGLDNTYFWWDPARGVAGVILMQFLPFADVKALAVYDTFERGVYRLSGPR